MFSNRNIPTILVIVASILRQSYAYYGGNANHDKWHYEEGYEGYGPSKWYKLPGAELCGHRQQSPIEINPSNFIFDTSCATPFEWNIDNTASHFKVSHTGEDGHTLLFENPFDSTPIKLKSSFQHHANHNHSDEFILDSFHIHWGSGPNNGSEHIYTGITTTLEIHFLHYSSAYASVSDAIKAWETAMYSDESGTIHTLAQIGVLFEEVLDGEATYNTEADNIIRLMATDPSMHNVWQNASDSTILQFALTDLMDIDDLLHNYYYYHGSLTAPPCTPGVLWHLGRNPVKIRRSTMDLFRAQTKLWQVNNSIDADSNFRPIQTNPSCIWNCVDNEDLKWCPHFVEDISYPADYWHYMDEYAHGPKDWVNVNGGELCGSDNDKQSPIEIDPTKFDLDRSCYKRLDWDVTDTVYNWSVTHKGADGHTLEFFNKNARSNVWLANSFQKEGNLQHPRYNLKSIHVHWGPSSQNGSEHIFTGATNPTTLEVHFVHYSNDYVSLGEALAAWQELSESQDMTHNDPFTLAYTAFLYEEVADDEPYSVSADAIILELAQNAEMVALWRNKIEMAYLSFSIMDLAEVHELERNYYSYEGSLTTPPCTPAVRWHLAKHTMKIRASSMDLFRASTLKWGVATGAMDADRNFRPIQLNNPSCIYSCSDRWCPQEEGISYPDWHYKDNLWDGPSNWWLINELCRHPQQSPIRIDPDAISMFSNINKDNLCDTPLNWDVDDTVYNWTINHQGEAGHTLYVSNKLAKYNINLRNSFMQTDYQHQRYKLYAMHFHWGPGHHNGSEHIYEGKTTTFEVHFVHFSVDYLSVGAAVNSWPELAAFPNRDMHTLGVVGVLFEEVSDHSSKYNIAADNVLLQFAISESMKSVWTEADGTAYLSFAITDLVNVTDFEHNYYHYWGSLTTPPCTPAVSWHLAQNTIKVRKYTMDLFREKTKVWQVAAGEIDADRNFRPVQMNPSCISTCASAKKEQQFCPAKEEDEDEKEQEEDPVKWTVWLWISLAILCAVLLIAGASFVCFKLIKDQKDTPKMSKLQLSYARYGSNKNVFYHEEYAANDDDDDENHSKTSK